MLMEIYVGDIHNDMTKTVYNGGLTRVVDYVTQKVLISDTTLRSFILPQVPKSTPKLRQLCGCELCIIPKDMQVDINGSRTRVIIYLQQTSFGIHTFNSLFSATSAAYYK